MICFYAMAQKNHGAANQDENTPLFVFLGGFTCLGLSSFASYTVSDVPLRLKTVRGGGGKRREETVFVNSREASCAVSLPSLF